MLLQIGKYHISSLIFLLEIITLIYIEMHGRLGNQLFQYAAARSLQEKTKQDICMSFRRVNGANSEGNEGWENSLKFFKTKNCEIYPETKNIISVLPLKKKVLCALYAFSYRPIMNDFERWYKYQLKWCPILDKKGIRWMANGYYNFTNFSAEDYFLNGAFESSEYFNEIREKLVEEIIPIESEQSKNEELYDLIRSNNSVCLSVRHFDLPKGQKHLYDVCNEKYYVSAIDYIERKVKDPFFIVFSDDIEWAVKRLSISGKSHAVETPNNPIWEKLRLMYSCKHFIIPNSTFAWWAQYLSRNENKIVIAPSRWFNNDFKSPLLQSDMILVDEGGRVYE